QDKDQFALIMPQTTEDQAVEVFRRLIRNFKKENHHGITFSIGIAQTGPEAFVDHGHQLQKRAEMCLTEAQQHAQTLPGFYIRRAGLPQA
ncbi:diguanylate cyclase domain-containing protein, partial [Magnetococcales bacterium HHB-1]